MKVKELEVNGCCFVCQKKFVKPFRVVKKLEGNIEEIEVVTAHTKCRTLLKKKEKLMKDLLDVEFDLYCIKLGIY